MPGAVDVGAHEFIGLYWDQVLPTAEQVPALEDEFTAYSMANTQDNIRKGFAALAEVMQRDHQTDFVGASTETYDAVLAHYLKADKVQGQAWNSEVWTYLESLKTDPEATVSSDAMANALIHEVAEHDHLDRGKPNKSVKTFCGMTLCLEFTRAVCQVQKLAMVKSCRYKQYYLS